MTAEEEARRLTLNNQVCELPIIEELKSNDLKLFDEVKDLKEGHSDIIEHLDHIDSRLEDGTERMDGIEGKVDKIADKLNSYSERAEQRHREIKDDLKDQKYQDLKEEKKELQAQIDAGKKTRWEVTKIVITGIVSIIVGGAVVYLFK